jgi:signal transduction histidine kinase
MTDSRSRNHPACWAWFWPVVLGLAGLGYGILDYAYLDRLPEGASPALSWLDEFVDLVWPVVMGIGMGLGVNLIRRLARLNRQLSLENTQLERHVLTNVITSQLMHDLRNPIHNLAAALDEGPETAAHRDILRRNVEQLQRVTGQLSRWGAVYDTIDPAEPVALDRWLRGFVEDQARLRLRQLGVQQSLRVEPLTVRMHPMLLELVFVTLLSNACDALARTDGPRRLAITARRHPEEPALIEIRVANTGSQFSPETLAAQGRAPIASQSGLGVGLLLAQKLLEQVRGSLALANQDGQAVVTLRVPGAA